MFRRAATLLFALLPTACALLCASCASGGDANSAGFENLLESVVKIDVWEVSQKDGGSRTNRAVGSGAIMSEDGTILTNAHVVNCYASKIVVTLANLERVRAEFVGWDHWTDLAVIRLDPDELKRKIGRLRHAPRGRGRLRGRHSARLCADNHARDNIEHKQVLRGHDSQQRLRNGRVQFVDSNRRGNQPRKQRRRSL